MYWPLLGLLLEGNAQLVDLVHRARRGEADALSALGFTAQMAFGEESKRGTFENPSAAEQSLAAFAPCSATLCLTTDCFLRCRYCYAKSAEQVQKIRKMPWRLASGVIESIAANVRRRGRGPMRIAFHGGGDVMAAFPVMSRCVKLARELAASGGFKVHFSAGLAGILTPDQRAWVVANLNNVTISLDGPPALHDLQRPLANGSGSYEYVANTLTALDRSSFAYGLRCTVSEETVSDLPAAVDFICQRFAVRRIKVEPLSPQGLGASGHLRPPDAVDFVASFREAKIVAAEHGRELCYSGARLDVVSEHFCAASIDGCAVTPEGWVTSCYEVLRPSGPMGEVFIYGRFEQASRAFELDEEKRAQLRSLSVRNKPRCADCFCKWHCAGDCPAKVSVTGTPLHPLMTDRCHINRELTKDQLLEALRWSQEAADNATGAEF